MLFVLTVVYSSLCSVVTGIVVLLSVYVMVFAVDTDCTLVMELKAIIDRDILLSIGRPRPKCNIIEMEVPSSRMDLPPFLKQVSEWRTWHMCK